jgi:hypothetical protein
MINVRLKANNARRSRNSIVNRQCQNDKFRIVLFFQKVVGLAEAIGVKLVVMNFSVTIVCFTDLVIEFFADLVKGFQFSTVVSQQ